MKQIEMNNSGDYSKGQAYEVMDSDRPYPPPNQYLGGNQAYGQGYNQQGYNYNQQGYN